MSEPMKCLTCGGKCVLDMSDNQHYVCVKCGDEWPSQVMSPTQRSTHDALPRIWCSAQSPPPSRYCVLPVGHHGRHQDSCRDRQCTWPNENETRPCPATTVAVLGVVGGPVVVRCGLLLDHDGAHRMAIAWEDA